MIDFEQTGLTGDTPFFSEVNAIWPDLANQRALVAPARNGVDRKSFKLLQGWGHVEQSINLILSTPFHRRVLRRWVGSFVPHILGESGVERIISRFQWAIATAIDLWEPNYRIKQVYFQGTAIDPSLVGNIGDLVEEFRLGHIFFRYEGVYRPRAHLGDFTPYERRANNLIGQGGLWDSTPA